MQTPNLRRLIVPDPGYIICDCDLSGADAQVVAWDAGAERLKSAFKAGTDIHNFNGESMWGQAYVPDRIIPGHRYTMRDEQKRGVHATNYKSSARTLAITLGWRIHEAEQFQIRHLSNNPEITLWHDRVNYDATTRRTARNVFGYRIIYMDRPANLLPKALAWIPQSTIAITAAKAAVNLHKNLPWLHVLMDNHDSVLFQLPHHRFEPGSLATILDHLSVKIPYKDPLYIPWGLAVSEKSWGDVEKIKWPDKSSQTIPATATGTSSLSSSPSTRSSQATGHSNTKDEISLSVLSSGVMSAT
jgi:hypothetical protein